MDARSAREALIVEALGGIDDVIAASDAVCARLSVNSQRIEAAASALAEAGTVYSAEVAQLTTATKAALATYIERRTQETTTRALEEHRRLMTEAATLAFADQLAPAVRDVARQVELHGSRVRRPRASLPAAFIGGVALGIGSTLFWMR